MDQGSISWISLGSNLGDRNNFLKKALSEFSNNHKICIQKVSSFKETEALEFTDQPKFLNAIAKIKTTLSPVELLDYLKNLEVKLGRKKSFPKGPREIDLDILYHSGAKELYSENLILPHPAIHTRPFIRELLEEMGDELLINVSSG